MAKTQEELIQLKQDYEALTTKFQELTEDELKQIAGGLELLPSNKLISIVYDAMFERCKPLEAATKSHETKDQL